MTVPRSENRSLIFAGGGTGGHLLPGIAVADQLVSRGDFSITFIGSSRSVEQQIIQGSGYHHRGLPSASSRDLKRAPWRFFWNNGRAFLQARQFLKSEKPAVVIGLGGFACVPVILAASWLKIPIVLLEQNIVPGRANRFLFSRASLVCTSFAETQFPHPSSGLPRVLFTGNPVRSFLIQSAPLDPKHSEETMILVLGGSQGAQAVNRAILFVLEHARSCLPRELHLVHQTGQADWEATKEVYHRLQQADPHLRVTVEPFFTDLKDWYTQADLVISRAGATTLSELACVGCPAVLIPYPNSIRDHQLINARFYEQQGAAVLVEQAADTTRTARKLQTTIEVLLSDKQKLKQMSEAIRSLARPRAASQVAEEIFELAYIGG